MAANDNFANAIVLSAALDANGRASLPSMGTNAGATAESGEPPNQGKTVWYTFTAPGQGAYFFATTQNPYSSPLRTIVQGYTSTNPSAPAFANLREVDYLAPFNVAYGGWDLGSLVAFNLQNGQTVWIRVDGVKGAEGNFPLTYGRFYFLRLGSCSSCAPVFGSGYACMGLTGAVDPGPQVFAGFGANSWPPGKYLVRYCGGAVSTIDDDPAPGFPKIQWVVDNFNNAEGPEEFWIVIFNGQNINNPPASHPTAQRSRFGGIATLKVTAHGWQTGQRVNIQNVGGSGYNTGAFTVPTLNIGPSVPILRIDADHFSYASAGPDESVTADTGGTVTAVNVTLLSPLLPDELAEFDSQASAEIGNRCLHASLDHVGGNIQMEFLAPNGSPGNPSPSFGLYRMTPVIQLAGPTPACASFDSGTSGPAHVAFQVHNANDVDWDLVTATLDLTGGVTAATPQQFLTLAGGNTQAVTIPFSAANFNVTATLRLSCPFWASDITFTVFLGPIVQFAGNSGPTPDSAPIGQCGGKNIYDVGLSVNNLGYWSIGAADLEIDLAATNGVLCGSYLSGSKFTPRGVVPVTVCPTSPTATGLQNFSRLDCNGGFSITGAIVAPPGAAAPVATVLTWTIKSGSTVLFTQSFNALVAL